jgi:hypothetical protein
MRGKAGTRTPGGLGGKWAIGKRHGTNIEHTHCCTRFLSHESTHNLLWMFSGDCLCFFVQDKNKPWDGVLHAFFLVLFAQWRTIHNKLIWEYYHYIVILSKGKYSSWSSLCTTVYRCCSGNYKHPWQSHYEHHNNYIMVLGQSNIHPGLAAGCKFACKFSKYWHGKLPAFCNTVGEPIFWY